jgi:hypothetical protein
MDNLARYIGVDDAAFWQAITFPEEDRHLHTSAPWDGKSYRWFRSANVIPMERYRHRRVAAGNSGPI